MKSKYIVLLGLIWLCSVSSYGQEQDNMNKLVTQCSKIVEYSQQLSQLKESIRIADEKIDLLRKEWKQICEKYLASDKKTLEDLEYLIALTDKVNEKDLFLKLLSAKEEIIQLGHEGKEPEKKKNEDDDLAPKTPVKESKDGNFEKTIKSKIGNNSIK